MRRVSVFVLVAVGLAVTAVPRLSHAEYGIVAPSGTPAQVNGVCFGGPYNAVVPCGPTPSAIATRQPLVPVKEMAVTGPVPDADGTSRYGINLTSQLVCFTPNEPIAVFTYGQTDAAALSIVPPTPSATGTSVPYNPSAGAAFDTPEHVVLTPGPGGSAALSLEVFNAAVGSAGLGVAAHWEQEGITRSQQLIPPGGASAGAAATSGGGAAAPSGTPPATATPGPGPFLLRACVSPNPVAQGMPATLYVQTVPGATCTATVTYGGNVFQLLGGSQVAGSDGFAVFPFTANAGNGTASVSCSYLGVTESTTTTFTATPAPAVPGVAPNVGVTLTCTTSGTGIRTNVVVAYQHPTQAMTQLVEGCISANGVPVVAAPVTFVFYYINHTSTSCSTFTGTTGVAACGISLSGAPVGYTVTAAAYFFYRGAFYSAVTTFGPVTSSS